ncbi:LytR/AlgR family response regulator transcription factor [Chryseobacterium jejuense]|uniref:LytR/AlgR family response regulator transcription factor n=1 Tax=Chryseobacterium jejuense TaxID=445960 RepID=UPI001AE3135C|nr:LytTR family DNA-binding domain-containing protein [Chryseobacterium jejuense]MBP2616626.1 DNA-binding LytR/AlgR family response regulator [Chryseobacterium jejuense]
MKIKCVIVDDEPNAAKLLEDYINRVPFLELCGIFFDGEKALENMAYKTIDIIFLDINLPGLNGLELASMFSTKTKIIFTTAYTQYAVESYEKNAIDYLLKPISFNRFLSSIAKAKEYFGPQTFPNKVIQNEEQQDSFFIKTGYETVKINFKDLKYIEGSREYVFLHTTQGKEMCYKRMKELAERLPEYFVRLHHSFIVNINHISKIDATQVFIDGDRIPIGTTYKEIFGSIIKNRSI